MFRGDGRGSLFTLIGVGISIVLFASLAYTLLIGQIVLWLFFAIAVGGVLHLVLFHRLVVAIEGIAHELSDDQPQQP